MKRFAFILFLHACLLPARAQEVTISGNDPEYAGCTLTFLTIDNYFCNNEIKLADCTVADNGDFTVVFPFHHAKMIDTRPGVYIARFFVEPGFSYEIKLPPRIDKSPEEEESPFFEPLTVYMNILTVKDNQGAKIDPAKELNYLTATFDEIFNPLYDRLTVDAAMRRPVARIDSTIADFRNHLPHTGNSYADNYALYRTGLLYHGTQRGGTKYISNEYFAGKPLLYDNEAYMELFNIIYDKYFMFFGRLNDDIYNVVNRQRSFSGLKRLLAQDGVFPDETLCELVVLKNIYDEFYADRFSRGALLHLLDSAIVHSKIERHREIADEIRSKITKLLPGFEPPDFSLYNQDSTLVNLQHYRGKYLYLMFCTTQNYVCLVQYELLEPLYEAHHKWLQIAIVSVDERLSEMRDFRQKSGYQWDFLHIANDPDILKDYDIRIIPTCYLIDPDGKLVISPAPAPIENLERTLWQELNGKGLWQEYIRKGWIEAPRTPEMR